MCIRDRPNVPLVFAEHTIQGCPCVAKFEGLNIRGGDFLSTVTVSNAANTWNFLTENTIKDFQLWLQQQQPLKISIEIDSVDLTRE